MNKLHVRFDTDQLNEEMILVQIEHEPTQTVVSGSCYNHDVERVGKELYEQLEEMVKQCKNWIH